MNQLSKATYCAGLAALLLTGHAQTWAQHSMQGMKEMPGMDMSGATSGSSSPPRPDGKPASDTAPTPTAPSTSASPGAPAGSDMQGMDHGNMKMDGSKAGMPSGGSAGLDMPMKGMSESAMGPMQGGRAPPDARDPDAYAEGMPKMVMPGMDMADDARFGRVLVNELEYARGRGERGQNLNLEAWYGGDYNKLWLKAEGERRGGQLDAFRTEVLWDHAIATYWSTQLGVRQDNGGGPSRTWLAFGVQGLAPYWFETEATAYVGRNGTAAARLEARYDLLLTQKWIFQPKAEVNLYSKNDSERGIGSGLSDMELGIRLRYEISRQFAPYIGVTWNRKYGKTADFARQAGESVRNTQFVAGVRLWF